MTKGRFVAMTEKKNNSAALAKKGECSRKSL
jgi:hypothetical protein